MSDEIIDEIEMDAEERMGKSVESTQGALQKLRSGRASPALLDHLSVDYYGNTTPLTQVGNVGIADSRTLTITPWEKTMVPAIEKAIMESDLGLNPITAGEVIRIPLPALTEERRREMTKLVRSEGENTKVAIRNIRRDAISKAKASLKNKEVSEDAAKSFEDVVQKMTDRFVANVDALVETKEAEIMEI